MYNVTHRGSIQNFTQVNLKLHTWICRFPRVMFPIYVRVLLFRVCLVVPDVPVAGLSQGIVISGIAFLNGKSHHLFHFGKLNLYCGIYMTFSLQ